jgi:hypothetical protein
MHEAIKLPSKAKRASFPARCKRGTEQQVKVNMSEQASYGSELGQSLSHPNLDRHLASLLAAQRPLPISNSSPV